MKVRSMIRTFVMKRASRSLRRVTYIVTVAFRVMTYRVLLFTNPRKNHAVENSVW